MGGETSAARGTETEGRQYYRRDKEDDNNEGGTAYLQQQGGGDGGVAITGPTATATNADAYSGLHGGTGKGAGDMHNKQPPLPAASAAVPAFDPTAAAGAEREEERAHRSHKRKKKRKRIVEQPPRGFQVVSRLVWGNVHDCYRISHEILGRGSSGPIYSCTSKISCRNFCIKFFSKKSVSLSTPAPPPPAPSFAPGPASSAGFFSSSNTAAAAAAPLSHHNSLGNSPQPAGAATAFTSNTKKQPQRNYFPVDASASLPGNATSAAGVVGSATTTATGTAAAPFAPAPAPAPAPPPPLGATTTNSSSSSAFAPATGSAAASGAAGAAAFLPTPTGGGGAPLRYHLPRTRGRGSISDKHRSQLAATAAAAGGSSSPPSLGTAAGTGASLPMHAAQQQRVSSSPQTGGAIYATDRTAGGIGMPQPNTAHATRRDGRPPGGGKLLLPPALTKEELAHARIRNEISISVRVDHPNIARLIEVFEDDYQLFMVTEYCAGPHPEGASGLHHWGAVKLVDLAHAKHWVDKSKKMNAACGTLPYASPGSDRMFLDINNPSTGTIPFKDFVFLMKTHYPAVDPTEVADLFDAMDSTRCGELHYNDFLAAMLRVTLEKEEALLIHTFRKCDVDRSGYMSLNDMKVILGDQYTPEALKQVMQDFDTNGNGRIDLEEFLEAIRQDAEFDSFSTDASACPTIIAASTPLDIT